MAVSRAIVGLISLLAVLATLWLTMIAGGGGHKAASGPAPGAASSTQVYGNAVNGAQNAVQQANADAQRAAGTSAGGTP
jgi:hypothetical protein